MFIIYLALGVVLGLAFAQFIIFMIETIWDIIRDTINMLFDI